MYNRNLNVKFVDLSHAKKKKGSQLETLCCGTPGFTAPELINNEGYCEKADIYSCGIILYYL